MSLLKKTKPPPAPDFETEKRDAIPPPAPEFVDLTTGDHAKEPHAHPPAPPGEQVDPAIHPETVRPLPGISEPEVRIEPSGAIFAEVQPIVLQPVDGGDFVKRDIDEQLLERAQKFYRGYSAESYRQSLLASPAWTGLDDNERRRFLAGIVSEDLP